MRFGIASFLFAGLLGLCVSVFSACSSKTEARMAEIQLPTLQCSTCCDTVAKALKGVEGVKEADVDLKKKVARVIYLPDRTTLADMTQAVAVAGYDANAIKADPKAYADLPDCCKMPGTK